MAQVYTLEPQTTAKVILHTTQGPLEVELWGRECPLTVKNFLQLSLDSYYDGTIFHRLVPGFILQGGDPTGTGHGGDSIYPGGTFADEFHPRLKFNRRGLLGMANGGEKDDNGSQFFLTLAEARGLDGKNTLFGKVTGDTIFNLVRWGEAEIEEGTGSKEEGGRPVFPVQIERVEVLVNPWPEEIKKTVRKQDLEAAERKEKKRQEEAKRKKAKKGKMMLSFVDPEEEDGGAGVQPVRKKPKFDTRLVVDEPRAKSPSPPPPPPQSSRAAPSKAKSPSPSPPADKPEQSEPAPPPPAKKSKKRAPSPTPSSPSSPPPESALSAMNAEIARLKSSLSRRSPSPPRASTATGKKKSLLEIQRAMLPPTAQIGRKKKKKRHGGEDEDEDAALERFRKKLQATAYVSEPKDNKPLSDKAPEKDGAAGDNEDQDDPANRECDLHFIPGCQSCRAWDTGDGEAVEDADGGKVEPGLWSHALSFEKDRLGKDLNWKKKNEELVVIDPREKEKELKMEMREKREKGGGRRTVGRAGGRGDVGGRGGGGGGFGGGGDRGGGAGGGHWRGRS